ncbi:NAD-dependent succinate-semialdehyde dehydrogenase [Arthrobacter sp. SAFR-044]|uniref:NAD-dependent succinate-semialdehyde dehydrogenase n=1 Tax=Arthrobacter sp. SAFR-044 TaxID=3387278 RepID=UPI003F7B78CA
MNTTQNTLQAPDTNTAETEALRTVPTQLFIGGTWRAAGNEGLIPVIDPSTTATLASIADASEADALDALTAASNAQSRWQKTPARERAEILRRAFELVVYRSEQLALLITLEMGKPLSDSRAEVTYAAEYLRWFSEEAARVGGGYLPDPGGNGRLITLKEPVGPCLMVTPWNFPLAMGTRKVAPAIAAGCTMVIKPATQTPLTMLLFAQIMADAGVPDGVLNVITSSSAASVTAPLMNDPRLRKLTFTGSTRVGQKLVEQSATQLLRLSMELGGNAPFIVFDDADLEAAVEGAMLAKIRNGGQACTAANRFYVQARVAQEFSERFADRMEQLVVGRGTEPGVNVGPLIDDKARADVAQRVEEAQASGARILTGGQYLGDTGYFYAPTVITDVAPGSRLLTEETFGPVAPVVPFDTDEEGLALANDTEYGLAAYAYTENTTRAWQVAETLQAGMVAINAGIVSNAAAPFGGIKHSGFGREGGFEGINEYLETKYVRFP